MSPKGSRGTERDGDGATKGKLAPPGSKKLREMRELSDLFKRVEARHPETRRPPVAIFTVAPVAPLVIDPIWLHDFRRLFQEFSAAAMDIVQCYRLPEYPLDLGASRLLTSFRWLHEHLMKVKKDMEDRAAQKDYPAIGFGPLIQDGWIAYQWTYMLTYKSRFLGPPLASLDDETFRDISAWLPTDDELAAYGAILDLLSRMDLESYSLTVADPEPDRESLAPMDRESSDVRCRLSLEGNRLSLNSLIYFLEDDAVSFIHELISVGPGHWVAGSDMGEMVKPRPDRVLRRLKDKCPDIAALIESKTGKGYRLTQGVITPIAAK